MSSYINKITQRTLGVFRKLYYLQSTLKGEVITRKFMKIFILHLILFHLHLLFLLFFLFLPSLLLLVLFETGLMYSSFTLRSYIVENYHECLTFLTPHPPTFCNFRHELPNPVYVMLGTESTISCMLGKHTDK